MKKTLLLITCFLLLLTGCGTAKTTSNTPATEPAQNPVESTPSTESAPEENLDFYIGQIVEFPVEISGIWAIDLDPDLFNLCMAEPTILELGDGFLTAKGILTNEIFSTAEEVTVQYDFIEYEGVNLLSGGKCLTEGDIMLAPAVPFTIDFLYDHVTEVEITIDETVINGGTVRYPLTRDTFTIELSEDGWKDYFTYFGTITLTDTEGNIYRTWSNYGIHYTGGEYIDFKWEVSRPYYFQVFPVTE